MVSTHFPSDVCTDNRYRKFNLEVYADHGGLFTMYPII